MLCAIVCSYLNTIFLVSRLNKTQQRGPNEQWSGEATRNQGFAVEETRVDVNLDGDDTPDAVRTKDRPVWMTESTVVSSSATIDGSGLSGATGESVDAILHKAAVASTHSGGGGGRGGRKQDAGEDIMSVLLQHEKQPGKSSASQSAVRGLGGGGNSSDSSDDEKDIEHAVIRKCLAVPKQFPIADCVYICALISRCGRDGIGRRGRRLTHGIRTG